MYEHKSEPIISKNRFYKRVNYHLMISAMLISISLGIGIIGYHFIANICWIDSLHNASMILSGMGPVVNIENTAGKLFSSFYALFSGIIFITNFGFILAPFVHRILHKINVE
ncbi:MAG: hypothetical protein IPL95_04950 [Saprospiraceae bacterium]|nr:hypothetical protein [Saprospiraceae bacterium]